VLSSPCHLLFLLDELLCRNLAYRTSFRRCITLMYVTAYAANPFCHNNFLLLGTIFFAEPGPSLTLQFVNELIVTHLRQACTHLRTISHEIHRCIKHPIVNLFSLNMQTYCDIVRGQKR
jgi:hypothetical protein